ncbi:hypothetical protein FD754_020938 [Muntiacus muntjak]|uniref:SAM domain-containing protein n=1 Tax=Muntiacus muntjak TaxID=9888 RepID=A0A5N3V485_MUNMU|nr:hypothetical protein FD754_020938 [Muntiacus muntjak]
MEKMGKRGAEIPNSDTIAHCFAIYDAIQDLDKKFDVIHGKVSKIHRYRCRMKSMWQSRSPDDRKGKAYFRLIHTEVKLVLTSLVREINLPSKLQNPLPLQHTNFKESSTLDNMRSSMICLFPLFEAPTSPVRNRPDFFRESFPEDPSTWSVDEVITFLQDVDPLTVDPLVDLFREHGIDGKALLLLKSDMMIKYMGFKLGTALKVCHYIERLKEGRYIYNL